MQTAEQLQRKVNELSNLLDAFKQLNSNIELSEVLDSILSQMINVVKAEAGSLWIVDYEHEEITATAAQGPAAQSILNFKLKLNEGIVGKVIATGIPELIEDVTKNESWSQRVDQESGFITKSMITVPLIAKGKVLGALQLLNKQHTSFFDDGDIELALTLANQSAISLHNGQMYDELNRMLLSMITTLAKTLDARDPYTAGHSERVAKYSVWIAKRLNLNETLCQELFKAALLHDIGKIGIPDAILLKRSRLTDEEFDIIKQHTVIGASILSNMEPKESMQYAIETARSHHEKMNGKGYPDGLTSGEIPLFAKIVGVADAFDAMTTVRPYSNGLTFEEAAQELVRCKGDIFAPEIVDAFTAVLNDIQFEMERGISYELKK